MSDRNDGHLTEVEGKFEVDTRLYKWFPPDVAKELPGLPGKLSYPAADKLKDKRERRYTLQVVVPPEVMDEMTDDRIGHYAERVRDVAIDFWGRHLRITFIPCPRDWIAARLPAQQLEWMQRVGPTQPTPELPPPKVNPIEEALKQLRAVVDGRTESVLPEVKEAIERQRDDRRTIILKDPSREKEGGQRFLYAVFNMAIATRASDIHLEWYLDPREGLPNLQIRMRIDGEMHIISEEAGVWGRNLLQTLAIMVGQTSGIDAMACHIRPQDGKVTVRAMDNSRFDCRVVFTPVQIAESTFNAVVRLQSIQEMRILDDLNFLPHNRQKVDFVLEANQGAVLVNGPTGSGKTVTLYAMLIQLHDGTRKIVTVEDPVEMLVRGLHQLQVDDRLPENSFAAMLRAMLRCDPDVALIGEIRDPGTANTTLQVAASGHMVFSTVHARDNSFVPRRILGYMERPDPVGLGSVLSLVLSQRLVRKPVEDRWVRRRLSREEIQRRLGFPLVGVRDEVLDDFSALEIRPAFSVTDFANYRGRTAVHELMPVSDAIRDSIMSGSAPDEIRRIWTSEGHFTMLEDALLKAKAGDTTLEEIRGMRQV